MKRVKKKTSPAVSQHQAEDEREKERRYEGGDLANQAANSHIPTKNIPTVHLCGVTHVNEPALDPTATSRGDIWGKNKQINKKFAGFATGMWL